MKNKGITLLSLLATIIIMLILATVSIKTLSGDNGVIMKAKEAAFKQEYATYLEEFELYKAFKQEYEETWKYEKIKQYISGIPSSLKIGEENCRIGVVEDKLWYRDTGNANKVRWAKEIGYNIISEDATIRMEITGSGTVKGIAPDVDIETKIGAEYKVSATPKTKNIQGKQIDYEFTGWYKNGRLKSKNSELNIEVVLEEENYEARFETDATLIYLEDGSIIIDDSVTLGGYANREDIVKVEIGKCVKAIANNAFYNCSNLENEIYIKSDIQLGESAFSKSGIKKVVVSDNITIPLHSFYQCSKLEEIILGDNITINGGYVSIGGTGTFENCTNLKYVTIGKNLSIMSQDTDEYLFNGCTNLEKSTIESINKIEYGGIRGLGSSLVGKVIINEGVNEIGTYAFKNCANLEEVVIPTTLDKISGGAFEECANLKSIENLEKVSEIGNKAFYNCINLENELYITKDTQLGVSAFSGSGIKKLVIADNIKIPQFSFYNCPKLEEIILGEGVELLYSYESDNNTATFAKCSNLHKVTIGKDITIKNSHVFYNSTNIETVNIKMSEDDFKNIENYNYILKNLPKTAIINYEN